MRNGINVSAGSRKIISPFLLRFKMSTKTITDVAAKLVTFETTLHVTEVLTRLNKELNKLESGNGQMMHLLGTAKSKDELVAGATELLNGGGGDFVFLGAASHDTWLNVFHGVSTTPATYLYTFGNPIGAQGILTRDLQAALHIPPRLLVLQNADKSGTKVYYYLPSSIICLGDDLEQRAAAEVLDAKLERLVSKVTGV
jgi:uncharacterized protein (DUF302 family)